MLPTRALRWLVRLLTLLMWSLVIMQLVLLFFNDNFFRNIYRSTEETTLSVLPSYLGGPEFRCNTATPQSEMMV